ncbi:hypothetical protein G6F52_014096 [Rhizopus delemar]|nr:hypothetical protein G6F31_021745 [Rhizopus arrhizus]KAG1487834.1 hypothetical protein G6F52_014096 [Rhizopus delemar]
MFQRHSDSAAISSHGSVNNSSVQPCASPASPPPQRASSESRDGHSSHHRNCAMRATVLPPWRRHSNVRTPSAANSAQASAP